MAAVKVFQPALVALILTLPISKLSHSEEPNTSLLSPEELNILADEIVRYLPKDAWLDLRSEFHGRLDFKYNLPNGETLYLLLSDHGASVPWYKVFVRTKERKLLQIKLKSPRIINGIVSFEVVEELPHAHFDVSTSKLSSWLYWSAGDQSESISWSYDREQTERFVLSRFNYDYITDGQSKFNDTVQFD